MRTLPRVGIVLALILLAAGYLAVVAEPSLARRSVSERGFVRRVLHRPDGTRSNYALFVPHVALPQKSSGYPVLFFLNGLGENGDDGLLQISNNFGPQVWELQETFPFLAIAPQCSLDGSWTGDIGNEDVATAMAILDQVIADYAIDTDRLYLTGVSTGGAGVFQFATRYPDRFAAVVPVSAVDKGADPGQVAATFAEHQIPAWLFFNGQDKSQVVEFNRSVRQQLFAAGCEYRATEYDRPGHNAWDYAYRDRAMYAWLLQHTRLKNRAHSACVPLDVVDDRESPNRQWLKPSGPSFDLEFEAHLPSPLRLVVDDATSQNSDSQPQLEIVVTPLANPVDHPHDFATPGASSLELMGQIAIRPSSYNHFRIRRLGGLIQGFVNGWKLFEHPDPTDAAAGCRIGIGFPEEKNLATPIREARYRVLASSELESEVPPQTKANARQSSVEAEPEINLQTLVSQWGERSRRATGSEVRWRPQPSETELGFGVDHAGQRSASRVKVGSTWVHAFSTRRCDQPPGFEYLPDQAPSPVTLQFSRKLLRLVGTGNPYDFTTAVLLELKGPQHAAGPPQPFERLVAGDDWIDVWHLDGDAHPRVKHRNSLHPGTMRWARMTPEVSLRDQIDTLHQQAALLAIGALQSPLTQVDFDQLELADDVRMIDGYPCVCIQESGGKGGCQRRFWVDVDRGLVRRFHGRVPDPDDAFEFEYRRPLPMLFGDTHIEIDYSADNGDQPQPTGWTVVSCQSPQAPLRAFSTALVESITTQDDAEITPQEMKALEETPGGWVVDEVKQIQHLVRPDGKHRPIEPDELLLQASYQDLMRTETGQAGLSLAAPNVLLRSSLFGLGVLAIAGSAWVRWRRKPSSTVAVSEE